MPELKGKRVLDMGCGFGEYCKKFVDCGAEKVVGIDISEKMLEVAIAENCDPKIRYINIPMENISQLQEQLILDDETAPVLIYHGLNGVYMKEFKKWILDARGNKNGVNAQFSIETEQLAFPIHPEMGEVDSFVVYPNPGVKVLEKLRENKTRTKLWDNLPTELGYNE